MTHLLLIDEDHVAAEAAATVLQHFGCTVEIVTRACDALRALRRAPPDAVLVSIDVPAMADGAFVTACHQMPGCATVPIVVMGVTPRAALGAIRAGAHAFIKKPIEAGGVAAALPAILRHEPEPITAR
jgi:CheY-like chemotaxis protein